MRLDSRPNPQRRRQNQRPTAFEPLPGHDWLIGALAEEMRQFPPPSPLGFASSPNTRTPAPANPRNPPQSSPSRTNPVTKKRY
jgi:hypothetical protein